MNVVFQVTPEWILFIINHGGSDWQKTHVSRNSCFLWQMEGWTVNGHSCKSQEVIETHKEHTGSTSTHSRCISPCFLCFGQEKAHKYILGTLMPFQHFHTCAMTPSAQKQCHLVVGHILIYTLFKFELNQTNGCQDIAICVHPCHSDLTAQFFWTMLVPTPPATSLASTPATPVLCQAPVNVPLPTYDWNVADQMQEFCLFKCQFETWFRLLKIKAEECLDYLLCILERRVMQLWTTGSHWIKATNEIQRNSLITLKAP